MATLDERVARIEALQEETLRRVGISHESVGQTNLEEFLAEDEDEDEDEEAFVLDESRRGSTS